MRTLGLKKRSRAQKIIKVVHLKGYGLVNDTTKKIGVIHMQGGEPMEIPVINGEFEVNGLKFKYQEKEDKNLL